MEVTAVAHVRPVPNDLPVRALILIINQAPSGVFHDAEKSKNSLVGQRSLLQSYR